MSEVGRILDQFARAHAGEPWHGSSIREILRGVTAEQASTRPPNGGHSIWEIVLHATGWRIEVARRATGEPAREPEPADWPDPGDPSAARWAEALAALDASYTRLVEAVGAMQEDRLFLPSNDPRNRPLGTGVTYYELLHGIVQHDAYHGGQIAVLKKVLGF